MQVGTPEVIELLTAAVRHPDCDLPHPPTCTDRHPTASEVRRVALLVVERLARCKRHRSPLAGFIPVAARWAADPPPALPSDCAACARLDPGWTFPQTFQHEALLTLVGLLDSADARAAALAAAPRLVDVASALLRAGPGGGPWDSPQAQLGEAAFAVLSSYVQDPASGKRIAALLADDACRLVMKGPGDAVNGASGGLSCYRCAPSAPALWRGREAAPAAAAAYEAVAVASRRLRVALPVHQLAFLLQPPPRLSAARRRR